jgi:hypothetical protein
MCFSYSTFGKSAAKKNIKKNTFSKSTFEKSAAKQVKKYSKKERIIFLIDNC